MKIKYNIYNNNNKFLLLLLLYFNINNNNIYCQNNRSKSKKKEINSNSSLKNNVNNGKLSEMDTDVSDNESNSTQVSQGDDLSEMKMDVSDDDGDSTTVSDGDNLSEMKMDVSDNEGKDNQLKDLDQENNEENKEVQDNTEDNNLQSEEEKPIKKRSKPMTMLQKSIKGVFFIGIVSFIVYVYIKGKHNKEKITGEDGGISSNGRGLKNGNEGGTNVEAGIQGARTTGKSGVRNQVKHNLTESLNQSLRENLITIQTEILKSMKENDIGTKKEFNVIKINKTLTQNQYIIPKTTDPTKINVIEFEELYRKDSIDDNMQQIKIKKDEIEKQIQQHNNNIIKDIIKDIIKQQVEQKDQDKIIDEFINDKFNGTYYNQLDEELFGYLMDQAQEEVAKKQRIPLIKFYEDESTNTKYCYYDVDSPYTCIFQDENAIKRFVNLVKTQLQLCDQNALDLMIAELKEANNIPITKKAVTNPASDLRKHADKYDLLYNAFNNIVDNTNLKLYETMQNDDTLTQGTFFPIKINNKIINLYIEKIEKNGFDQKITFSFYEQLSNGLIIKKMFMVDKIRFDNNGIYNKFFTDNDCLIYEKNINTANKQISWFHYGININKSNEIRTIHKNNIWLWIKTKEIEYKGKKIKTTDEPQESPSE